MFLTPKLCKTSFKHNITNLFKFLHTAKKQDIIRLQGTRNHENTGWAKKHATLLLSISSPIIDQFSKILSLAHSADNLR